MNRKISIRIKDELERSRFISLLEVIPPRLNCAWKIVEPELADVVVVDIREPGTEFFLSTCKATTKALPLAYGESNDLMSQWFIKTPVVAPSLINMLNQISDFMKVQTTSAQDVETKEQIDKNITIAVQTRKILDHAEGRDRLLIHLDNEPYLYVDVAQQLALIPEKMINKKANSELDDRAFEMMRTRKITATDFAVAQASGKVTPIKFQDLDWFLMLFFAQGKLHKEVIPGVRYQLKNWPNFARLPHAPIHVMLCAKFSKQPQTALELAATSCVSDELAINFFNACFSQGLLLSKGEIVSSEIIQMTEQKNNTLVNKIIKRLFG